MYHTTISVILPVLNEAERIVTSLETLHSSSGGALETIVVDGGSTDRTLPLARPLATRVLTGERRGRGFQMHKGALAATGNWLLFLHADTRLPDLWRRAFEKALAESPATHWTAFPFSFDRPEIVYRIIEFFARWRFRLTGVPQGDQAVAVRRDVYFAQGGFPDIPLMEDYALARRLKRLGPVCLLPFGVVTSARRYRQGGPLRNALRNSLLVALYYLGVSPKILARFYR